jgi:aryl carrier-like protein
MGPSYFVVLEKMPLTPNGKTDSKLLQTLDTGERLFIDEYVTPRTEIERKLCEIWKEVLCLDRVGINDNFFKIGGDSILAIQMVSKAKKYGLAFSVKDIFLHKTLSSLSSIIVQDRDFTEDFECETGAFGLLDQSVKSDVLKVLEERTCKQK